MVQYSEAEYARRKRAQETEAFIRVGLQKHASLMGRALEMNLRQAILDAARKGVKSEHAQIQVLAAGLMHRAAKKSDLEEVNRNLATAMQAAVVDAYIERVESRKKVKESYRVGQGRYAGGALRRALNARGMVTADQHGINFINQTRLAKEARHWARLNFGALPASTPSSISVELKLGGGTVGREGFRRRGPRPAFKMPAGYWEEPGTDRYKIEPVLDKKGKQKYYERTVMVNRPRAAGQRRVGGAGGRIGRRIWQNIGKISVQQDVKMTRRVPIKGTATPKQVGFQKRKINWQASPAGSLGAFTNTKPLSGGGKPRTGARRNYSHGGRSSTGKFFPKKGSKPTRPTQGITGVNFLDAGFEELAERFPEEYGKLLTRWFEAKDIRAARMYQVYRIAVPKGSLPKVYGGKQRGRPKKS